MARELAPAGLRSSPKPNAGSGQVHSDCRIWGRFAAQRERAPSPQSEQRWVQSQRASGRGSILLPTGSFNVCGKCPKSLKESDPPVARELAPAGLRSSPKPNAGSGQVHFDCRIWGRFAAQRERAPSPQSEQRWVQSQQASGRGSILLPTGSFNVCGKCPKSLKESDPLWRGSLLPLGCAAAPNQTPGRVRYIPIAGFGAASQPSGSELPRHKVSSVGFRASRHLGVEAFFCLRVASTSAGNVRNP